MAEVKTFWLINQYASTPETGMGGRHYYLAKELAKQGHRVYVIAASFTHLLRAPLVISNWYEVEDRGDFKFIWVRERRYENAHDKKRILNWFKFALDLAKLKKVIDEKPDCILYSSPSLIPFLGALRLSNFFKCRLVWDIRDIWPLTLIELGGVSPRHPFVILHKWIERLACKKADAITSNLPFAIEHLRGYGVEEERFTWIPNGFYENEFKDKKPLDKSITSGIPKHKFIVGYTGTLGTANAIQTLLDTAFITSKDSNIHYVVVGSGKMENVIKQFIEEHDLTNFSLLPPIPKAEIPSMLNLFDVCYVGFNRTSLYRFGTSLNKLPEYLISGKPIIYSIDSPFKPVDEARAGFTVPAEDPHAVANAIYSLASMPEKERVTLGNNGIKYAQEVHDYAKIAVKLSAVMTNC